MTFVYKRKACRNFPLFLINVKWQETDKKKTSIFIFQISLFLDWYLIVAFGSQEIVCSAAFCLCRFCALLISADDLRLFFKGESIQCKTVVLFVNYYEQISIKTILIFNWKLPYKKTNNIITRSGYEVWYSSTVDSIFYLLIDQQH